MKINFLIILLIASLALNIVFFVKTKGIQKEESNTIEKTTTFNLPSLSENQRFELQKIIKEFKIKLSDYKNRILSKRIDIIDELGNPEFDLGNLKKITDELNKTENELNLYFVDSLGKIAMTLNTEQRIKLLLKFSKFWFFLKTKREY